MSPDFERKLAFLEEMGLGPLWVRRAQGGEAAREPEPQIAEAASPTPSAAAGPAAAAPVAVPAPEPRDHLEPAAFVDPSPATDFIPDSLEAAFAAVPDVPPASGKNERPISEMNWDELEQAVSSCTRCGLCRNRNKTVFGVGDRKARWLFIGEGPGRDEDLRGEPFVGRAGQLLDSMLGAIDLARGKNAYIANVVKCRATDENGKDRRPSAEEAATCLPYLQRQIALLQPDVMVALGKTAAVTLLGLDPETPVSGLRGRVHRYAERPMVVSYHPAYLLRTPLDKKKTWADLCLATAEYAKVGAGEAR